MKLGGGESIGRRRSRGVACGLVVLLLLLLAGVAAAATGREYSGLTSQRLPIAFRLSTGSLTGLQFRIDVVCPSRREWRVTASRFPPIKVVHSRFGQTFASHNPSATATVSGKIGKKQINGALAMKRFIAKEHHFCRGSATFTASN